MKIHFRNFIKLTLLLAALQFISINSFADTIYMWCGDGTIQKIDTNGVGSLFTTNHLSGYDGPVGLALDNVGNLYAGASEMLIWKFSPAGVGLVAGDFDSVSGLAFDNAGNLYVTSPNYNEVAKLYYGQGYGYYELPYNTNHTQSHLNSPMYLAFDRAGNFYVANNTNANPYYYFFPPSPYDNTIEKFSANFTDLGAFATGLNCPSGMAFDNAGNLYVANSGTNGSLKNTVVRFDTNGVRSNFAIAGSGLSSPQGLAFDSAGNLYVANSGNGTIVKLRPNGFGSIFASGLNSPTSIAIFPGLNVWSATPIKLNSPKMQPGGVCQFDFNDNAGLVFTVLATTNVSLNLTNWTVLGGVTETSSGVYQFTDLQATNSQQRFYRLCSP